MSLFMPMTDHFSKWNDWRCWYKFIKSSAGVNNSHDDSCQLPAVPDCLLLFQQWERQSWRATLCYSSFWETDFLGDHKLRLSTHSCRSWIVQRSKTKFSWRRFSVVGQTGLKKIISTAVRLANKKATFKKRLKKLVLNLHYSNLDSLCTLLDYLCIWKYYVVVRHPCDVFVWLMCHPNCSH